MLRNNSFFKSILLLTSGSFFAQVITTLSLPILTRVFEPDVIGMNTYIISVASIFLSVINGRYDVAIVTERNDDNIFPLLKLCILIGVILSVVASLSFGVFFYASGRDVWMALYVFLILLSYALVDTFTAYNNRQKDYKTISSVYVLRNIVQNFGAILGGLIVPSVHSLSLPYTLGLFAGLGRQAKPVRSKIKEILFVPWSKIKNVACIHKNQPLYSAPALLANSLSYSLVTILFESLYGLEQVGFYSISVRLLGLPLALVGTNVSKVYVERAAKEYHTTGNYSNTFKKTFLFLFCMALPMCLVLFLFASPLCSLLLGRQWYDAGKMIVILIPMFAVRLLTSAMSPSFVIVKKQKVELILQSLFLMSSVVSFLVSKIYLLDIYGCLKIISLLFTASYIIYLIMIFIYSRIKTNK